MKPQEKVLLGFHGDSTEGFISKNRYCLECIQMKRKELTKEMKNEMNRALGHLCAHIG